MNKKGKLVVISGPSGVGKDTVANEFIKLNKDSVLSISATSRPIREGEKEGVNYYYYTKEEFTEKIKEDYFLEYFEYNNNLYGTPKGEIQELLNKGINVVLVIEVKGALYIKEKLKDSVLIFLMPPSIEELKRRIIKRNIDSKEEIEKRLEIAKTEIEVSKKYDYIITNNVIQDTVDELEKIINNIELTF